MTRPRAHRTWGSRRPISSCSRSPTPIWRWLRRRFAVCQRRRGRASASQISARCAIRCRSISSRMRRCTGSKAVLVRLLGGLDYWRYGGEQLGRRCRELGIALAIVPGDGRPDMRLAALSTAGGDDLARLEALLDTGGVENTRAALSALLMRAKGGDAPIPGAQVVPAYGVYRESARPAGEPGAAAVVFYRSHLLAGDVAPIDALVEALDRRGLATSALYVPSLKAPDAAEWLRSELKRLSPRIILNATAFAARDGADGSALDVCDCPVLQVAIANASRFAWDNSQRGLSASDLAMHVVLPELDGRLFAGVISFKEQGDIGRDLGLSLVRHVPYEHGIAHVADLAAAWARLGVTPRDERRVGLMLSTYPGRPDQIAHAVGLDGLESAVQIAGRLEREGYSVCDVPDGSRDLVARLTERPQIRWPVEAYKQAFAELPQAFRDSVIAAWGLPEADAFCISGAFSIRAVRCGNLIVGLQPERGQSQDRKAQYHDPATPPRHSYVAFYLWLRHVAKIDALIHLGAHGTLEWLPGKAVAGSEACAPRAVLGSAAADLSLHRQRSGRSRAGETPRRRRHARSSPAADDGSRPFGSLERGREARRRVFIRGRARPAAAQSACRTDRRCRFARRNSRALRPRVRHGARRCADAHRCFSLRRERAQHPRRAACARRYRAQCARPRARRPLHRAGACGRAEPRPIRRPADRAQSLQRRSAQHPDTNGVGQRQARRQSNSRTLRLRPRRHGRARSCSISGGVRRCARAEKNLRPHWPCSASGPYGISDPIA